MFGELERIVGKGQVLTSTAECLVYESDALTTYRRPPRAVVLPASTEEVAEVVRWCNRHDVPFVPRGAGTGLSGGALPPEGGIVVELARMRRILEIHPDDRTARVEAGVINLDVSAAVAPLGLHFAPDPSSQSACTIGGNVAENSGGPHTMKYGITTDHVLGLTVVLPDGSVTELGGPEADVPGLDLVGLFVGSEGTFGIVTEALLRLVPVPAAVRTLLFVFPDTETACHAVSAIVAAGVLPAALEILDRKTIEVVEASVLAAGYPTDAGAVLLTELDGIAAQVDDDARRVKELATKHGATETREAADAEDRARLWKGRKGAFGAMGRLRPDLYVQDAVVPRSKLPEVLRGIDEIAGTNEVLLCNVFHAGDGNLHPNICFDRRDHLEMARVHQAGEQILKLCLEVGGSLSGEHGIGLEKRDFMELLFAEQDLEMFRRVRVAWNPDELCNPGKILPGPKVCGEFRPDVKVAGVKAP